MVSQAQEGAFNMEVCSSCDEKPISHTETAVKKQAENKTEPSFQPILWQPQNRPNHTKRKNKTNPHKQTQHFLLYIRGEVYRKSNRLCIRKHQPNLQKLSQSIIAALNMFCFGGLFGD
jgi:hypothetical protein